MLPGFGSVVVTRPEQYGGDKTYASIAELEADYAAGALHPGDLKPALCKALNAILKPVRDHFSGNAAAAALLKQVKAYKVTR